MTNENELKLKQLIESRIKSIKLETFADELTAAILADGWIRPLYKRNDTVKTATVGVTAKIVNARVSYWLEYSNRGEGIVEEYVIQAYNMAALTK